MGARDHAALHFVADPMVSVRAMQASDFEFVRGLAAEITGYTVPPDYVLWMLTRCCPELCAIAELPVVGGIAYVLGTVMSQATPEIFIWQFASSATGLRHRAPVSLAIYVHSIVIKRGIQRIHFTAQPGSRALTNIESLARACFGTTANESDPLPASVSRGEQEYYLEIRKE